VVCNPGPERTLRVLTRTYLAERVGFEPTLEFPLNTLSKRAPSATRPSLRREFVEGTTLRKLLLSRCTHIRMWPSAAFNSMGEFAESATGKR
jgi:hypothetical protein